MTINPVPGLAAFRWFVAGCHCFTINIGAWLAMSLLFFIAIAVLMMVPYTGIFLVALLSPLLLAGLYHAAQNSLNSTPPQVENLINGFNLSANNRTHLGLLGLCAALSLLITILLLQPLSSLLYTSLYAPEHAAVSHANFTHLLIQKHLLVIWGQCLLLLFLVAVFGNAVPLIALANRSIFSALCLSFQLSLYNLGAIAVFSLLAVGCGFLAAFTLGIGFIILLPVLVCAHCVGVKEMLSNVSDINAERAGINKNKSIRMPQL